MESFTPDEKLVRVDEREENEKLFMSFERFRNEALEMLEEYLKGEPDRELVAKYIEKIDANMKKSYDGAVWMNATIHPRSWGPQTEAYSAYMCFEFELEE